MSAPIPRIAMFIAASPPAPVSGNPGVVVPVEVPVVVPVVVEFASPKMLNIPLSVEVEVVAVWAFTKTAGVNAKASAKNAVEAITAKMFLLDFIICN